MPRKPDVREHISLKSVFESLSGATCHMKRVQKRGHIEGNGQLLHQAHVKTKTKRNRNGSRNAKSSICVPSVSHHATASAKPDWQPRA